jgi:hypothetical protein
MKSSGSGMSQRYPVAAGRSAHHRRDLSHASLRVPVQVDRNLSEAKREMRRLELARAA